MFVSFRTIMRVQIGLLIAEKVTFGLHLSFVFIQQTNAPLSALSGPICARMVVLNDIKKNKIYASYLCLPQTKLALNLGSLYNLSKKL